MTFANDLAVGQEVERKVLKTIQASYPKALMIDGYFKDFDIFVPETKQAIEVKYDKMASETGNIVIEVSFNGKDSGLMTTKADWWVFCTAQNMMWFKPCRIKDYIVQYNPRLCEFTGRGDSKPKKAYLIKEEHLSKHADFLR